MGTGESIYRDTLRLYHTISRVTEVGVEVNTEDEIHSQITFVTTDQIQMLFDYPTDYLLQENRPEEWKVLQETDFGVLL